MRRREMCEWDGWMSGKDDIGMAFVKGQKGKSAAICDTPIELISILNALG